MRFLLNFTDEFALAIGLWPIASLVLTLPILAYLYHRDGRLRAWSAVGVYLAVLYLLSLACFTLYPLPSGTSGPGITYGIAPQLNPLRFVNDVRYGGAAALFQILANVVFFMPLGFFCQRIFRRGFLASVIVGFLASLAIETTQLTGIFGLYPYAYRTFDVNDLMWNTGGAVIGWGAAALIAFVLPVDPEVDDDEVTDRPGLVRRLVALLLDLVLIVAATAIMTAAAIFISSWSESEASLSLAVPCALFGVSYLVVEGVIPWLRDGRTPGSGFVRMTFETRPRFGFRRFRFYVARLVLMPLFIVVFPLGIAVLVLYYPRRHRLPYDAI